MSELKNWCVSFVEDGDSLRIIVVSKNPDNYKHCVLEIPNPGEPSFVSLTCDNEKAKEDIKQLVNEGLLDEDFEKRVEESIAIQEKEKAIKRLQAIEYEKEAAERKHLEYIASLEDEEVQLKLKRDSVSSEVVDDVKG